MLGTSLTWMLDQMPSNAQKAITKGTKIIGASLIVVAAVTTGITWC